MTNVFFDQLLKMETLSKLLLEMGKDHNDSDIIYQTALYTPFVRPYYDVNILYLLIQGNDNMENNMLWNLYEIQLLENGHLFKWLIIYIKSYRFIFVVTNSVKWEPVMQTVLSCNKNLKKRFQIKLNKISMLTMDGMLQWLIDALLTIDNVHTVSNRVLDCDRKLRYEVFN